MIDTKILCIDDDPMFGVLIEHIFKSIDPGIEVVSRESSTEGLNYLRNVGKYDFPRIILLDINMPKNGGFQFLDAFKNYGLDLNLASIFLVSSTIFPEDQRKGTLEPMVKGIFTKPFSRETGEIVIKKTFNGS